MGGRLAGKVALITGTGSGQGRAAALLFAREGAKIAGCDIDAGNQDETARLVREAGGEMYSMAPVDLSDPDQAAAWADGAVSHFGQVDICTTTRVPPGSRRSAPCRWRTGATPCATRSTCCTS